MNFFKNFLILVLSVIIICLFIVCIKTEKNKEVDKIYNKQMKASKIPKIIWTFWDFSSTEGGKKEIPEIVKISINSWKKLNPNYLVFILNKNNVSKVIPNIKSRENGEINVDSIQYLSDYVRIYVINHYGGVWIDASVIMFEPLDRWLEISQQSLSSRNQDYFGFYIDSSTTDLNNKVIENWFFAAPPNSEFIKLWFEEMEKMKNSNKKKYTRDVLESGVDLQKIDKNYLFMHIACQVVLQKKIDKNLSNKIKLIKAEDSAFKYQDKFKWNLFDAMKYITGDESANENPNKIIKLTGASRKMMKKFKITDKSIIGRAKEKFGLDWDSRDSLDFFNVYIINLDRRTDRMSNFEKNYKKTKLYPYKKITAIEGKIISLDDSRISETARNDILESNKVGYRKKHYELSMGGIGCYLSHVKAWETALSSDKEISLIFEDDIKLEKDIFFHILENIIVAPPDWDIILFGNQCWECEEYNEFFLKVNRFILAHCYLVNKKGLKKIFESKVLFPITQQVDFFLGELANLKIINIYSSKKFEISQTDGVTTDIQIPLRNNENENDRLLLSKN
jgi:GR25 family glycosyltransferase involved in LPS biosynthesis